jgi:alanine racemase
MSRAEQNPANLKSRPIWAEVSLGTLAKNFRAIRKFVNPPEEKRKTPRKILSIVKGNGYGHGGPQVAKALEKAGSDWFGVTCTEEGIAVRKAGVRNPVLVRSEEHTSELQSL